MVKIGADYSNQLDLASKSFGLVRGLTAIWYYSAFVKWTRWTLAMAVPWWCHHNVVQLLLLSSQIAPLCMLHLVFEINFQIHSVSLTSLVTVHLLIHLLNRLCRHHHSRHPSVLHSFISGAKPTFSTNPSHFDRLLLPLPWTTAFMDQWTGLHFCSLVNFLFVFHLNFLFDSAQWNNPATHQIHSIVLYYYC